LDEELNPQKPAFNMVIFSKDRACQLDQLLSSLQEHVPNWDSQFLKIQVLYDFSDRKFRDGYRAVQRLYPSVFFHQQNNLSSTVTSTYYDMYVEAGGDSTGFKADYLRLMEEDIPYIMHYMDDMVAIGTWGRTEQMVAHRLLTSRPELISVSLRLHPGVTKCYSNG